MGEGGEIFREDQERKLGLTIGRCCRADGLIVSTWIGSHVFEAAVLESSLQAHFAGGWTVSWRFFLPVFLVFFEL